MELAPVLLEQFEAPLNRFHVFQRHAELEVIHEEADFVCAVNRVLVLGSCLALFIFLIDLLLLFALVIIIILFVADLLFILTLLLVEKVLLRILVIIVDHLVQ